MPAILILVGACSIYLLAIPIMLLLIIYHAWVISILWLWFAVPIGLPVLTTYQVAGLYLIKSMAFNTWQPKTRTDAEKKKDFLLALLGPIFILMIAYIFKWLFL